MLMNKNNINVHFIKNNKFKTNLIVLTIKTDLHDLTYKNLLFSYLRFATNKADTLRLMNIKKNDLNIVGSYFEFNQKGKALFINIAFYFLDNLYTKEKVEDKIIEFVHDILYSPVMENKGFNKEIFETVKRSYQKILEDEAENSFKCAVDDMFLKIAKESPIAVNISGYLDELKKITIDKLYKFYLHFIENLNLEFYLVGKFKPQIKKTILNTFKEAKSENTDDLFEITHNFEGLKKIKVKDNYNQNILIYLYTHQDLTKFEKKYVLPIYNYIFGGSHSSRLYDSVREKHSLCYSIHSSSFKYFNNLMVNVKIYKDNVLLTEEIINEVKSSMNSITKSELDNAKEKVSMEIKNLNNDQYGMVLYHINKNLNIDDSTSVIMKSFKKVTVKDLENINNKIILTHIYERGK